MKYVLVMDVRLRKFSIKQILKKENKSQKKTFKLMRKFILQMAVFTTHTYLLSIPHKTSSNVDVLN